MLRRQVVPQGRVLQEVNIFQVDLLGGVGVALRDLGVAEHRLEVLAELEVRLLLGLHGFLVVLASVRLRVGFRAALDVGDDLQGRDGLHGVILLQVLLWLLGVDLYQLVILGPFLGLILGYLDL